MQSIKNKIIKKIFKIMICCTTFNMNTTSKHKVNRKSQEKPKLLQYICFINRIKCLVYMEFKTTYFTIMTTDIS